VKDLDGRTIVILDHHWQWFNLHENIDDTPNETHTVMEIMRQIEADYNCKVEVHAMPAGGEVPGLMVSLRAAGDNLYDMVAIGTTHADVTSMYTNGIFMDLNDPRLKDIIDMQNNPWDPESALGLVSGRQFGVHFKSLNSGHLIRSLVIFNTDYLETYSLPNLYEMVFNMTWTWETFESTGRMLIQNSNQQILPVTYNRESQILPSIIASNGGRIVDNTPNGYVFKADEDEKTLAAMQWFVDMVNGGIITRDATVSVHTQSLADGLIMFHFTEIGMLRALMRADQYPSEYRFGMLPIPRGPGREDYASVSFAAHTYHIVDGIDKPEQVAAVLVAMANRLTRPDVLIHELEHGLQDMQSGRVLEMMLDKVVIDHSRVVGTARSTIVNANQRVETGQQTPVAAMQMIAGQVQSQYDAVRIIN
jgi:ABC-type glycerol-3-phosphate transport system substrate-binding protein